MLLKFILVCDYTDYEYPWLVWFKEVIHYLFLLVFMEPAINESCDFCVLGGAVPRIFVGLFFVSSESVWGRLVVACETVCSSFSSCNRNTASWEEGNQEIHLSIYPGAQNYLRGQEFILNCDFWLISLPSSMLHVDSRSIHGPRSSCSLSHGPCCSLSHGQTAAW